MYAGGGGYLATDESWVDDGVVQDEQARWWGLRTSEDAWTAGRRGTTKSSDEKGANGDKGEQRRSERKVNRKGDFNGPGLSESYVEAV